MARAPPEPSREVVDPGDLRVHRRGPEDERRQVRQEGAAPAAEGGRAQAGRGRQGDREGLRWHRTRSSSARCTAISGKRAMQADTRIRVDKWLWAARLVKTRALAADAVKAGRVKVNGVAAKPSKEVGSGDRLERRLGPVRTDALVRGGAARRGPASEASKLYEETPESRLARERHAQERRLARQDGGDGGRPTEGGRPRIKQG